MKTQISRNSFDPSKEYTGVYQQQGRMLTDSDWNEMQDIIKHRLEEALRDIVGDGTPESGGLEITSDLEIVPGRVYACGAVGSPTTGGEAKFPYSKQPDFPDAPGVLTEGDILYADVWERGVTYVEDPSLLDPGLGGADTCTRTRTVVQVKRYPMDAGSGTGLLGEYYQYEGTESAPEFGASAMTQKISQIDQNIDFGNNWPNDATSRPTPSVEPNYFVIRWTGFLVPPIGGKYTFAFYADDGVRLWIDDQIVIDAWPNNPWKAVSNNAGNYQNKPIALSAGNPYTIRVEFFNAVAPWKIKMYWSLNDLSPEQIVELPEQIVPQSWLHPPLAHLIPAMGDAPLTLTHAKWKGVSDPDEQLGNYVFRLEVHDVNGLPNAPTSITFKWSSENAAEAYRSESDIPIDFMAQDWAYEFYSEKSELHAGAHFVNKNDGRVWLPERGVLSNGSSNESLGGKDRPFVRRWDGYCRLDGTAIAGFDRGVKLPQAADHGVARVKNGELTLQLAALELKLTITGKTFLAGDHWLVVVREDKKEAIIEGAKPIGILHRYARLGRVIVRNDKPTFEPAKRAFPTLTKLTKSIESTATLSQFKKLTLYINKLEERIRVLELPLITSFSPTSIKIGGIVTIYGWNFDLSAIQVKYGIDLASSVTVKSRSEMTIVVDSLTLNDEDDERYYGGHTVYVSVPITVINSAGEVSTTQALTIEK